MLAFEQNGKALQKASLDEATGRIVGQGPYVSSCRSRNRRHPIFLRRPTPGAPRKFRGDRFHAEYDHNGGKSSSAVVAIRVKPLPRGTRNVDWQTTAVRRLGDEQVLVFGAIKSGK